MFNVVLIHFFSQMFLLWRGILAQIETLFRPLLKLKKKEKSPFDLHSISEDMKAISFVIHSKGSSHK